MSMENPTPTMTLNNPEIWLKNLDAMYRSDMRFAQELDDLADDGRLSFEQARNGAATVKVRLEDSREVYLHSKFDPQGEAKKFVDSLDLNSFVFIISGIGLGYQIRELFDRTSDQILVVVLEPELSLIRAALWNLDFSEEIKKNQLVFLHRADKGLVHGKLMNTAVLTILGTVLTGLTYSKLWHADFHSEMRTIFTDFMSYCRMSFVTLLSNCKLTQKNVANNLASYACCPPIDMLRQRFAGFPAILVAAGPSVQKNVHLLKQAKGKAVIIAVQTMLKPLLKMGIEPDFVTSLDYNPISKRFFEGVEDFGRVHLVAEPKVTWPVVDTFTGNTSLLCNEFAELCLGSRTAKRDGLRAGSTVAHLSFYLAEYIGADPIILIGQDLGFSDNMYYAPGTMVHDMWAVELNRFYTLEMKEWERVARNGDILRKIKDIHGRDIYTDEQMFTYLQQFERDFATAKAKVIDATEGGAFKRNTQIMPLAKALEEYATKAIPSEKFEYIDKTTWYDPDKLPMVAEELKKRIEEIRKFQEFCQKTLDLETQMQECIDKDTHRFNKLVVEIDSIRSMVGQHNKSLQMVCQVSAMAELRRFIHDRHLGVKKSKKEAGEDQMKREIERAKDQMKRDTEYMESLIKGADELVELLEEALGRVEEKILPRRH